MSGFDPGAWDQTSVDDEGGNQDPPGLGTWITVLDNARAFTSKVDDDYVALTLRVATGEQAGYSWDVLLSFKSPGAVKVTKTACARIGVDVDGVSSLQELDGRLKERINEWVEVAVVASRNPEYPKPTTFINGLAQQPPSGFVPRPDVPTDAPAQTQQFTPAAASTSPYATDSDIPF